MTHEEVEQLIVRETAARHRQDMRHLSVLGGIDEERLLRWSRRTSVGRYALTALLVALVGLGTSEAVAATRHYKFLLEGDMTNCQYIASQGDPQQAYDTLTAILQQSKP